PLGHFEPPAERLRATLVSGESGKGTIQETLARVMKAKGVKAADIGDRLHLGFDLPQLTDLAAVAKFAAAVADVGSNLVVIDPLYLMLTNVDAKNLFEMGRVLMDAAGLLLARGCTPIICHHANRTLQTGTPMEL